MNEIKSIFYSWQSDLPKETNQNGIRQCLRSSLNLVEESFEDFIAPSLEAAWPPEGDIEYLRQRCAVPRGFYADQLRHWQMIFPAERFLVLSFEELVKNTTATLNRVFEFLGLEAQTVDTSTVLNKGTGNRFPVIAPGLRIQLESLYRQKNQALEGITGQKSFWL